MIDLTITCPNCKTEIKLTESLAAPLLESTRQQCEQKIAEKEADVVKREAGIREKELAIKEAKETIDQEISEKMVAERAKIASEAAKKARQRLSDELEEKAQEITDLKEILELREGKLAEAQKAQVEV